MRAAIIIVFALIVLLFGTIRYIRVGDYGQGPVRLMSPSVFDTYEKIGDAIANRFWANFHRQDKINFYIHPKVKNSEAFISGVYQSLARYGVDIEKIQIMVFPLEETGLIERPFEKSKFHWFVVPFNFTGDLEQEVKICQNQKTWVCLASRAALRNNKKKKDSTLLSAVVEDHHKNNLILFIQDLR